MQCRIIMKLDRADIFSPTEHFTQMDALHSLNLAEYSPDNTIILMSPIFCAGQRRQALSIGCQSLYLQKHIGRRHSVALFVLGD